MFIFPNFECFIYFRCFWRVVFVHAAGSFRINKWLKISAQSCAEDNDELAHFRKFLRGIQFSYLFHFLHTRVSFLSSSVFIFLVWISFSSLFHLSISCTALLLFCPLSFARKWFAMFALKIYLLVVCIYRGKWCESRPRRCLRLFKAAAVST